MRFNLSADENDHPMKKIVAPSKKSPASKLPRKSGAPQAPSPGAIPRSDGRQRTARLTITLPTRLERDTALTPLWVAEGIVQEVERYLHAHLPANWARRLAAKAHYLYPRHRHFKAGLNRPGWRGLENLRMFMRHWTAGWLKRAKSPLYKQLPYSFGLGRPLTA